MYKTFKGKAQKYPAVYLFMKFCSVGILGTLFNYSVFFVLYGFLNVYYLAASAAGFTLAIFLAFSLNKRFTFKVKDKTKTKGMMIKYFAVNIFSLFLGMAFLTFFVEFLKINVYLANALILVVTASSNFTGSKLFVFKTK